MNIVHSIYNFKSKRQTVVTLGTFDGVHLGHQKIIARLIDASKKDNLENVILTFFPHPRMVLKKEEDISLLNTIQEKTTILDRMGIENVIIHPFDEAFAQLSAKEFVKTVLVKQLRCKKIIIGYDHRFGKNRSADINDLASFGKQFDFEVDQISAQEVNEVSVSSTKIRKALQVGNIPLANSFLGYEYPITGKVVKGRQIGRTIGFPTANLVIDEKYKLIPPNGVYLVTCQYRENLLKGLLNIGNRPTFSGQEQTIEVYFLHFEQSLYDETITIMLQEKIREEIKFSSVEALVEQLHKDKKFALDYFKM